MLNRVFTMFKRYTYLHRRSVPRLLELFFWPVMDLLVWGFLARYMQALMQSPAQAAQGERIVANLFVGMIFWDIVYRSQQAISLALMEELWTKNILNLLISPLRTWEWTAAAYLYGFVKTIIISAALALLAALLYRFSLLGALGLALIPFAANLLLMGWAFGIFTAGLLLRWGHAAEALIWGVPFLIQPFSAIFYPLSAYPAWLRPLCLLIPSTHVLEGMRATLGGSFSYPHFFWAVGLNLAYMLAAGIFFSLMLESSRESGKLVRISD